MSREHMELVRRVVASDAHGFFEAFDEHIVCDVRSASDASLDFSEVLVGWKAVSDGYRRWWGTFTDYSFTVEEMIDAGQSVILRIHERGVGKGSGLPIERDSIQVWTLLEGRIVRIGFYPSRESALEAVGLPE